ncbi:hypothetical protein AAVH_15923 [Aphelenchoides avenae]|nr:hypothetical protein AAVH_15923 [Aphelenchus avenae]
MLFSPLASSRRRSSKPYQVVEHSGTGGCSSAPSRLGADSSPADYASGRSSRSQLSPAPLGTRSRSSSTTRSQPLRVGHWQILGEGVLIKPLSDAETEEALHDSQVLLQVQREAEEARKAAQHFRIMDEPEGGGGTTAETTPRAEGNGNGQPPAGGTEPVPLGRVPDSPGSRSHLDDFFW